MATVVQGNCVSTPGTGQTSFTLPGLPVGPTSGNLLVLYYGARDSNNDETPTFSMPSGFTKAAEAAPMEFHSVGIAFKVSDGTETGSFTVTLGAAVSSSWIGVVEYNQSGVTDWALDKASDNGSGSNNVSSIASGSTGTLGASVGVAAIAGTSRTGSQGLTTDTGSTLTGTDTTFTVDAGSANFIAAWLSLSSTAALNATISESNGASRMGAAIATFIEAGGGATIDLSGSGANASAGTADAAVTRGLAGAGAVAADASGDLTVYDPSNLQASVLSDDVTLTWDA